MSAFLATFGIRDYVYGGLVAALLGTFAFYTHHERVIGADEALAPVAVLAQKVQLQVATAAVIAQSTEKDNAHDYTAAVAAPTASLGLVCHDTSGSEVPKASAFPAAAVGEPAAVDGSPTSYDPSGPALQLAAEADAEITYLQGRVHELEAQMESTP